MDTSNYTEQLNNLKLRLKNYKDLEKVNNCLEKITFNFSKIDLRSHIIYIIPPLFVFIVLLIWRPNFATSEHIDKENNVTKRYKFTTLIIISLIIGLLLDIGIFLKRKS